MMEAMYFGLPVVASAVKGHEDLVREGETGLLFPWGDTDACARAVSSLAAAPALCRSMGRAGAEAVEAYRLELVLPQVMEAYRSVLPELPAMEPIL